MIKYDNQTKFFHLDTENSSYIIRVLDNGMLCHWYYGAAIAHDDLGYLNLLCGRSYCPVVSSNGLNLSRDIAPLEYPTFGNGDYRVPALTVETENGRRVNDLVYKSHRIFKGKEALEGLPYFSADDSTETLEITAVDTVSGYEVRLYYSVFAKHDAITRHAVIVNTTDKAIKLASAQSLSVDLPVRDLDIITLSGAWARERHLGRRSLSAGAVTVESRRGASGHQQNPFAAIAEPNADENSGEVYGFALVYSGNFRITAEVDQFSSTRFQIGINPFNFTYLLAPGESFTTPEAIAVYSNTGFNGMSHCFHEMCRGNLGRSADKSLKRPILINSWEAMYFDISEEKITNFVSRCKGLGIDTFVLDDGWFGHRDNDDSSLGDWFIDSKKFPGGFDRIISACKENGMDFGLWFEPEMISADSELYTKHPDWCIHVPDKSPVESRRQLVLDMSRPEVVDCIYEQVADILSRYDISYVKWDMNRNITDNGSASLPPEKQGEHAHRYILGVYELMRRLTAAFPKVLFEGCAGGGGRFDFGILYYMPQFWTSDDTDAIERLKIQYGTSYVYPLSAMTAHVSACPNHQTGRTTPFKTRGDVAQVCNFGYELAIEKLSSEELSQISEQIELHKRIEPLIYNGDFYRIISPFDTAACCWQIVSKDKKSSVAVFATQMITANNSGLYIKLKGLDPNTLYNVQPLGIKAHGSTLMNAGIPMHTPHDFTSCVFEINAE